MSEKRARKINTNICSWVESKGESVGQVLSRLLLLLIDKNIIDEPELQELLEGYEE